MIDLSRRAIDPERLDTGVAERDALESLADLRFVNVWLGNRARMLAAIRPHLRQASARPARLLDVGCGSADFGSWVRTRTAPAGMVVGVDIKWLHVSRAPREVRPVAADAAALPFAAGAFDVVTASLFLHHFNGPDVSLVLRELYRVAGRALIVNDLRRARVPFVFGRIAFPLLFTSQVSVDDGLLSIRRAFTQPELQTAFDEARIPVRITRTWPYRLLAVAEKPETSA
jgi:2-polyprenyl-3-methyl-5-hydroxy-6-metoxy-1,4-benzoquinol methylase